MTRPRYFAPGQLQFITASTYRRVPLFSSPRFGREFFQVLDSLRAEFNFYLLGWVLIPEHFHLLIGPQPDASTRRIMPQLKQRTAARILRLRRENTHRPWCAPTLEPLRLPATVHNPSNFRVGQRRFGGGAV